MTADPRTAAAGGRAPEMTADAVTRVPDRPSLDGIEAKWTRAWAKERVVQV